MLLNFQKHVLHLTIENIRRHTAKKRCNLHAVVHIDARSTAANGIHARQMCGCFLQRIHDAIEVILRIGLEVRIPFRLLAEHNFAINHRCCFAITAAEIETDTTTAEMTTKRFCQSAFWRDVARVDDFNPVIEHLFADDL